jgi:hypothetical protein
MPDLKASRARWLCRAYLISTQPVKMLSLSDVTQIDVLEEYQLLLVLSERQVFTFPMDALENQQPHYILQGGLLPW